MITAEIVIFLQRIGYYSFKSIHIYLQNIYVRKIINLIMYEPNIYVNNGKFISMYIDNVSVLQLPTNPFLYRKFGLIVFNSIYFISSVIVLITHLFLNFDQILI